MAAVIDSRNTFREPKFIELWHPPDPIVRGFYDCSLGSKLRGVDLLGTNTSESSANRPARPTGSNALKRPRSRVHESPEFHSRGALGALVFAIESWHVAAVSGENWSFTPKPNRGGGWICRSDRSTAEGRAFGRLFRRLCAKWNRSAPKMSSAFLKLTSAVSQRASGLRHMAVRPW